MDDLGRIAESTQILVQQNNKLLALAKEQNKNVYIIACCVGAASGVLAVILLRYFF